MAIERRAGRSLSMAGAADIDLRSGSSLADVEGAFVYAMDAAEAYVCSYEQLHGRLKEVSSWRSMSARR